jgi:hypothetical protein
VDEQIQPGHRAPVAGTCFRRTEPPRRGRRAAASERQRLARGLRFGPVPAPGLPGRHLQSPGQPI